MGGSSCVVWRNNFFPTLHRLPHWNCLSLSLARISESERVKIFSSFFQPFKLFLCLITEEIVNFPSVRSFFSCAFFMILFVSQWEASISRIWIFSKDSSALAERQERQDILNYNLIKMSKDPHQFVDVVSTENQFIKLDLIQY